MTAGSLKEVRAVGWYVDEYKRAQVSINLTNFDVTSLHQAFDQVCKEGQKLGLRVTGSEIVGLVPLKAMLEAGRHYLKAQGRSTGVSEAELVETAVQSLGLSDLSPFNPAEKIIDYRVDEASKGLRDMTLSQFVDELASESAAPGGGSVAALCASLSAALSTMVANLTFDKKGFEKSRPAMDSLASRGQELKKHLLTVVDMDMQAFNKIIDARRLAKGSEEERAVRDLAIDLANKEATEVPLGVLASVPELLGLAAQVVEGGNPNSLSDSGVAALTALAAAEGAYYNVLINLQSFDDSVAATRYKGETRVRAQALIEAVRSEAQTIARAVLAKLS